MRHLADILLGEQWTAERLALEQTVFPYCERFAFPLRRDRMISGLMEGWKAGSTGVLNSNWSQVTVHPSLNFCPGCVKALGMSAWHRVHQLPAVFVCPECGKRLRTTGVFAKQQTQLIEYPSEPQAGEAIEMRPGLLAAKIVAKNSHLWLLRNPGPQSEPATLRAGMGAMVRDAGWIGKPNKVRPELGQAVAEQLGAEKLAKLECRIEHQRKWFRWAWEQRATLRMHPLQYLLLLAFLERDAADLFTFAGKPLLDDPPVSLKRPDVGPRSLLNRAFIIKNRVLLENLWARAAFEAPECKRGRATMIHSRHARILSRIRLHLMIPSCTRCAHARKDVPLPGVLPTTGTANIRRLTAGSSRFSGRLHWPICRRRGYQNTYRGAVTQDGSHLQRVQAAGSRRAGVTTTCES
jgi:hypothetical protein